MEIMGGRNIYTKNREEIYLDMKNEYQTFYLIL